MGYAGFFGRKYRDIPASPIKPIPKRLMENGSGTATENALTTDVPETGKSPDATALNVSEKEISVKPAGQTPSDKAAASANVQVCRTENPAAPPVTSKKAAPVAFKKLCKVALDGIVASRTVVDGPPAPVTAGFVLRSCAVKANHNVPESPVVALM
jgi:hypothetical protein